MNDRWKNLVKILMKDHKDFLVDKHLFKESSKDPRASMGDCWFFYCLLFLQACKTAGSRKSLRIINPIQANIIFLNFLKTT